MLLKVKVIPNAARSEVVGRVDDTLKVKVQAVPESGRANKALCELLAGKLGCRPRQVSIHSGEKSRVKVLEIPEIHDLHNVFN